MLAQKTGAAPTAPKPKRQGKSYNRYVLKSSTKIKDDIGELLWSLQFSVDGELEERGWQALERLLRRYIGIVHTRGANDGRKNE
jgi:hypothetical protein